MIHKGVQAILARGGTYRDLKQQINKVPIVEIPLSDGDILSALASIKPSYKNIFLVQSGTATFDPAEYHGLLKLNSITHYHFRDFTDLEQYISQIPLDPHTIVLGSGLAVSLAKQRSLAAVQIANNATTIRNEYENTKNLLFQLEAESQKLRLLESLLHNIDDGVVVLNGAMRILHFNGRSEQLLGCRTDDVHGRDFADALPKLHASVKQYLDKKGPNTTIFHTNWTNISVKVEPIKPIHNQSHSQILITLKDITKLQELEQNLRFQLHKKGLVAKYSFGDILSVEKVMREAIEHAQRCALQEETVLIYGKSGTGKELFAQSIHNYSGRKHHPFVAVNCAALPESLLESELFGYESGAFTGAHKDGKAGLFELAHGGTLFLDEINSMPLATQAKILRVLEEKEVMRVGSDRIIPLDVRILAASNDKLTDLVSQGQFRMDLFFRLNVLELSIPTLKERPKDILYLFRHFVASFTDKETVKMRIDPAFKNLLLKHHWRGNVRELRNVSRKYVVYGGDNSKGEILAAQDGHKIDFIGEDLHIDIKEINRVVEQLVIQSLLAKGLTKTDTAKTLGISRTSLFNKMRDPGNED